MTIIVRTQYVATQAPVKAEMSDASGTHLELTRLVGNLPPIRNAFAFTEGTTAVRVQEK